MVEEFGEKGAPCIAGWEWRTETEDLTKKKTKKEKKLIIMIICSNTSRNSSPCDLSCL